MDQTLPRLRLLHPGHARKWHIGNSNEFDIREESFERGDVFWMFWANESSLSVLTRRSAISTFSACRPVSRLRSPSPEYAHNAAFVSEVGFLLNKQNCDALDDNKLGRG